MWGAIHVLLLAQDATIQWFGHKRLNIIIIKTLKLTKRKQPHLQKLVLTMISCIIGCAKKSETENRNEKSIRKTG